MSATGETEKSGDLYKSLYFDYRHHDFVEPDERQGVEPLHPVVVVGAGPVGLALALDLARRGIAVVVLEEDDTVNRGSRAVGTARRSLEIFDRLGAGEPFMEKGMAWKGGQSYYRDDLVLDFEVQHDPRIKHPPMISIAQCYVEQYLLNALEQYSHAQVRWSSQVLSVEQQETSSFVSLTVSIPTGTYTMRGAWVVACDGARSAVRKALGLELKGSSYEGRYLIADIKMKSSEPPGRRVWFNPPGFPGSTIIMHKQPDDIWRIDYQLDAHDDLDEEVSHDRVVTRVTDFLHSIGETADWQIDWISPYRAHSLTLENYRHNRVILAGDAAHLVPIFGARGMNGGIDDANNLGWKLAYVVQGAASPDLLDSYSQERVAAARENMRQAEKSTHFMTPPSHGHQLMRDAVLSLAVTQRFIRALIDPRQVTEVKLPDSPLNLPGGADDVFSSGPAAGAVCPNLPVKAISSSGAAPTYLQLLFGPDFTLVSFRAANEQEVETRKLLQMRSSLPFGLSLCEIWSAGSQAPQVVAGSEISGTESLTVSDSIVADTESELFQAFGAAAGTAYLVRPDGHIAGRWTHWDASRIVDGISTVAHLFPEDCNAYAS